MNTRTTKLMLLSGVASVAMMSQAFALEAEAFVNRVAEVYRTIGYDFEFGPATLEGDTVTVDGVTVGFTEMDDDHEPMEFDTQITFSGVTEEADGSYFIDSVTIPDIDEDIVAEPPGHITLADIEVGDVYLPAGEVTTADKLQLMGSFTTGALSLSRDGVPALSYDSFEARSTFEPSQGPDMNALTSTMVIAGIDGDFSSFRKEADEADEWVDAVGLTNINGDIRESLSWSMEDGHLNMDEFSFDFADLGRLDLAFDLTGVTPELLDQIYSMQAQMASRSTEGDEEENNQAQMTQALALMQGVNVVGAHIRYDDDGVAGRVLDYLAQEQGVDRDAYVDQLLASMPALVGQTGIPELNDIVVLPVSKFLEDPQSLEIRVAPPSPTSALVLMAAAANPAGLITALGLTIQANSAAQ